MQGKPPAPTIHPTRPTEAPTAEGRVVSVNVGTPREFTLNGKRHSSAIWKEPVEGRLAVRGVNLAGDDQADRNSHGGSDKAIYADALEDYVWWSGELGTEVAPPRLPCYKLGNRMGDRAFPRRFAAASRWGAYLRIVEEGDVGAGDPVVVLSRPDHSVTIDLIARIYEDDHSRSSELLAAPRLPESWRSWAADAELRTGPPG